MDKIKIKFPNKLFILVNIFFILLFLLLPYYLFEGRLFLGGDDTRFYYSYPSEVLKSLSLFSWNNISSLPLFIPNHQYIPLLLISLFLEKILVSKVILSYFSFSLVMILGFVYFQKFIRELIGKEYLISFTGAIIYILSPIIAASHLVYFLSPVWLVCLVPIISYYYVCFMRRGKSIDIVKVVIWSICLSLAFYAVVWIAAILVPLLCGIIIFSIFVENPFKKRVKKTLVFISFIFSSQLFWLVPFAMSLRNVGENNLGVKPVSKEVVNSFAPTVLSIATGNIIYPLLTFYHRQIVFDFEGQLKYVFLNYFDHVLPLGLIFIIVLFLGIVNYRRSLNKDRQLVFLFFLFTFIAALYFFTVNIGVLKYIFLFFGFIPGFSVFRNFIDKFSLGYIFIYASMLSLCLLVIKKYSKFYFLLIFMTIAVVLINFVPIKQVINRPVWTTKNIYQTLYFPDEYLEFAEKVKSTIPTTVGVIAFPQNIASYAIITEDNAKNAYVGTSPFKFLTGVNDLSGTASFPSSISSNIVDSITDRNYQYLLISLSQINVGYLMVTSNVPPEVKNSYLFKKEYLRFQDEQLIRSITSRELIKSKLGNYKIYKIKNSTSLINSTGNVYFKKINPVKYKIVIKNLNSSEKFYFHETYHPGWKLFSNERNYKNTVLSNFLDVHYLLRKPIFDDSHHPLGAYGNEWVIKKETIVKNIDSSRYVLNKDGSIDVILTLYFLPQVYFYIGTVLSLVMLFLGFLGLYKKNKK